MHGMIDPDARPVYALVLVGFAVSLATLVALGFSLSPAMAGIVGTWPFVAIGGLLARRIGLFKLSTMMQAAALIYGQGLILLVFHYGMGAVSGSYADALLASIDERLGFHWPTYVEATLPFRKPLTIAYKSFAWQPLLLLVTLVMTNQSRRLWTLIFACIVASALTATIFPFTPAFGVYNHYGLSLSGIIKTGNFEFHQTLEYLRGGGRYLSPDILTGLVSFPSYHTAEVVMFLWAGWSIRWLRWSLLTLNLFVLASVPVIGAHYLVDMIGGAVVGGSSVLVAHWWMNRTRVGQEPSIRV